MPRFCQDPPCTIFARCLVPWNRSLSPFQFDVLLSLRSLNWTTNSIKLPYNYLLSPRYRDHCGTHTFPFPRIPMPSLMNASNWWACLTQQSTHPFLDSHLPFGLRHTRTSGSHGSPRYVLITILAPRTQSRRYPRASPERHPISPPYLTPQLILDLPNLGDSFGSSKGQRGGRVAKVRRHTYFVRVSSNLVLILHSKRWLLEISSTYEGCTAYLWRYFLNVR